MSPGQGGLPSDSIKVVPGRSKLRVESSNPVARGNPTPKTSKVKLISPDEAIKLSSGATQMAVSPVSKPAHATSKVPKPVKAHQFPVAPRHVPVSPISLPPRPKPAPAIFEVPKPVQAHQTPEAPRTLKLFPISEPPRPKPARATSEVPKPVQARPTRKSRIPKTPRRVMANPAAGPRKEIVCGLRALSLTTTTVRQRTTLTMSTTTGRRRTSPNLLQSKPVEPSSPRALQIRSRVKQQASNAIQVVEGTIAEVGDRTKDHVSREIRQSISDEEFSELLRYRPALQPTWKGRIVDSAMLPDFDCEFWAKPAANISRKAHRLLQAMPTLLKVELLPTGHILNDVFDRNPRLSNVAMYLFPDEKKTERLKGEHCHLFEAMTTRNAMIKVNINGTELLIFSSKLLDETSQFIINTQKKTENFLWGCFLETKNSQALLPVVSCQTDKDLDDEDIIDMDLDTENSTPSLVLKLLESQSTPSRSLGNVNKECSFPPGFEKIWAPQWVKLNIQGTSNPESELSGYAGLVRYQSGKWMFGYSRFHKSISEIGAGLLAIYHGLRILWDSGFRRIRLETSSLEIINALTTKSDVFLKRKSILGVCKDMILKEWECDIYQISKEQNSCAELLAKSRVKEEPQGLVFYEYPPRCLVDLLEKDRLGAI